MGFKLKQRSLLQRMTAFSLTLVAVLGLLFQPLAAQAGFFDDFGIKDELELGRKFDVMVRSQMPLLEDPEIKQYVRHVVDRLVTAIPPQPFTFKTDVLLHNSMNAFAVPGGYVFVHTGLIMRLDHESELAGVLAHELAHVTQRHVANRIDRSKFTTIASILGALAGALLGGNAGGAVIAGSLAANQRSMLNYSRLDETEADQVGLHYLVTAGFRPQGMIGAFEKIRKLQWMTGLSVPEYLSTHPDSSTRINEISARLQSLPAATRNRREQDTRFNRAKTLLWAQFGTQQEAIQQFDPQKIGKGLALMGRAMLAERQHRVLEAEKLFHDALPPDPAEFLIRRQAGISCSSPGHPRAESLLASALKLNPKDVMAQFYIARLLDDSGRRTEAQERYKQLLRTHPEDAELHQYLGISFGKDNKLFEGWLHLAYSALYRNNHQKTREWLNKARLQATSPEQKARIKTFETIQEERKAFQKGS